MSNLTNEQIQAILDGAPESSTHYVHSDSEYWDLRRSNDHPKVFDKRWIDVDDDWGIDIFSTHQITDLREILNLRKKVEKDEVIMRALSLKVDRFKGLGLPDMPHALNDEGFRLLGSKESVQHFKAHQRELASRGCTVGMEDAFRLTEGRSPLYESDEEYASQLHKGEGDDVETQVKLNALLDFRRDCGAMNGYNAVDVWDKMDEYIKREWGDSK